MGDIMEQTVSGAISTGTHGTGRESASIAAQVKGLELVTADGSVLTCSEKENPEVFAAARRTAAASSSTEAGVTSRAGRATTLPPQLRQTAFFPLAVLLNGASTTRRRLAEPAVPEETDRDRDGP